MVWYGILKTGVPEIDIEHANIDNYLNFALDYGFTAGSFEQLVSALLTHFRHEEEISERLQLNMSQAHLDEHRRLRSILESIRFEDKTQNDHLLFFKQTLMNHISEFDSTLNPDN